MNIFNEVKIYAEKWAEKSRRNFTSEEIKIVKSATVVASTYGNSACFMLVSGGQAYIPMDRDSTLGVGESIDLTKAVIVTLGKTGENDINRILI